MWMDFEEERNDLIDAWEEMIKDRDKEEITPKTSQETPKTQEIHDEEEWIQQKEKERSEEIKGKIGQEEKEDRRARFEMELDKNNEQKEQASKLITEPEIDKVHEAIRVETKIDNME
jgi:hypothetical protein